MEGAERARKQLRAVPDDLLEYTNAETEAWRERVASFRPEMYPFVPAVPPTIAALFGWRCRMRDTLSCLECKTDLPLQPLLLQLLMSAHSETCLWYSHRVDPYAVMSPGASSLTTGIHRNLASLPSPALCGPAEGLPVGLGPALGTSEERARLAVCGWHGVPQADDSVLNQCGHCQRSCAQSATFDPVASHRLYCVFRLSRPRAERLVKALPPDSRATELPSYVSVDSSQPLVVYIAKLVLGEAQ